MIQIITILLCALITALSAVMIHHFFWFRLRQWARITVVILGIFSIFLSCNNFYLFPAPQRTVEITALGQKSEFASGYSIALHGFSLDGEEPVIPAPVSGRWVWDKERYCWVTQDSDSYRTGITQSVSFDVDIADRTEIVFSTNEWKGLCEVSVDGQKILVDTYSGDDGLNRMSVQLPRPAPTKLAQASLLMTAGYLVTLASIWFIVLVLILLANKLRAPLTRFLTRFGFTQKLLNYQFLFEELVKRDFKTKYKRTALGMVWSLLSPLLTLFVMKLVFTQFFGQSVPHYAIYIFCGNVVFNYFNESTSQGMTSLVGNASIFTKVNVPKYLFLLSKNIQTLINFFLTLVILFAFCALDHIVFTWKFIMLLYPILMLVLFNIGVGLILSALYVFFKDIQYLWSVFTMLLVYTSAIFYSIDHYTQTTQNLFLLNPIYLFIRYFRKIIIDSTIPTPWFHLLMLVNVVSVVGVGCWMYKKYNTKFLYYV